MGFSSHFFNAVWLLSGWRIDEGFGGEEFTERAVGQFLLDRIY
jgi:hypothetical protein